MAKIESLTSAQEKRLIEFRRECLDIGLCTEPADRPRFERAAGRMYELVGARKPAFIWLSSPAMAILAIAVLRQTRGQLGDQLRDQLSGQLGDQLWDQLGDQLRGQLGDQLRGQLGDQLRDQLGDQLGDQLRDQLWDQFGDQLRGQLGDQLRGQLGDQLRDRFAGQQDMYWISLYLFAKEVGVRFKQGHLKTLLLWNEVASSACWWFPRSSLCFVSDRPELVEMTDGLLHNESGPSVRFRDGWSVWSINGVRVDEQIVMRPDSQTVDQIVSEGNEEIKRIRIDRFGWPRFLAETDADVIDNRANPIENTKEMLCRINAGGEIVVLVCHCPSQGKVFALEVEPSIKTCEAAQNYLHSGSTIDEIFGPGRVVGRS